MYKIFTTKTRATICVALLTTVFMFLSMAMQAQATYKIISAGSTMSFNLLKNDVLLLANQPIQAVIDYTKTDANGANCNIQFGNGGTDILDIGSSTVVFNSTVSQPWGYITLLGSITSSVFIGTTISLTGNVFVDSKANINNTYVGGGANNAISHSSTGMLTISGGTISSATGRTVYFGHGQLTISGGTILATVGDALSHAGNGILTISDGAISATDGGRAIFLNPYTSGHANISGGSISSNGTAIYHASSGKIIISGSANITSTGWSAVYLSEYGGTATKLEMIGGTITNTANGSAVFLFSTKKNVKICNAHIFSMI